jgi:hypothetical protein
MDSSALEETYEEVDYLDNTLFHASLHILSRWRWGIGESHGFLICSFVDQFLKGFKSARPRVATSHYTVSAVITIIKDGYARHHGWENRNVTPRSVARPPLHCCEMSYAEHLNLAAPDHDHGCNGSIIQRKMQHLQGGCGRISRSVAMYMTDARASDFAIEIHRKTRHM